MCQCPRPLSLMLQSLVLLGIRVICPGKTLPFNSSAGCHRAAARFFPSRRKPPGIAFILVIFLVLLLAAIVVSFRFSTSVALRLAQNRALELQARYLARAGIEAAKAVITRDQRETNVDTLEEDWASKFPDVVVDGVTVRVRIVDEARKININSLVFPATSEPETGDGHEGKNSILSIIKRAIHNVAPAVDAEELAQAIYAYTQRDLKQTSTLADEGTSFKGRPFQSLDELLEVRGVSHDILYPRDHGRQVPGLSDVLTIASLGKVNVNTAGVEVMTALSENMTVEMAQAIIDYRAEVNGLHELDELKSVPGLPQAIINEIKPFLTTQSMVFKVIVEIRNGGDVRVFRGILQRPINPEQWGHVPVLVPGLQDVHLIRWNQVQ